MGWILLLEFFYAFTVIYQPLPLMRIIFHKSCIIFELPVCIQTVLVEPYRLLSTKLLGQEFLHLIFQNLLYEQQLEWSNLWWPFAIKWKLKHTTLSEHFIKTYHSVGTFPKSNREIVESHYTRQLTFLAWYRRINKKLQGIIVRRYPSSPTCSCLWINNQTFSRHDIAEILLKMALNNNNQ